MSFAHVLSKQQTLVSQLLALQEHHESQVIYHDLNVTQLIYHDLNVTLLHETRSSIMIRM